MTQGLAEQVAGTIPSRLLGGYQHFRADRYPSQARLYHDLAAGQRPDLMVIACADSRVDPATIFSARPGELFILRNVANLVPSPSGRGSRSLGAALAFAVGTLCVSDIVVMGHGGCGGIAACLQMHDGVDHSADHVAEWMQEALPARHEVDRMHPGAGGDARQRLLEHVAIIHSLANLAAYPPVPTALAAGRLRLHGAWFSIGEGLLEWLDEESGRFVPVPEVAAGPA